MSALLDLPREIRDKILNEAIAPVPPPLDATDTSNRAELRDLRTLAWFGGKNVLYETPGNRMEVSPLLRVNRQLRSETLALQKLHSYDLDVMIVDEFQLWPTWLSVPFLTTRVDKVYAAFRTCGIGKRSFTGFSGGAGGPPMITWCFFTLLERFLKTGPNVEGSTNGGPRVMRHDKRFSVKLLELDVRSLDIPSDMLAPKRNPDSPYDNGFSARALQCLRRTSGIDYHQRPEWIANFICSWIDSLLFMSYHTAEFGAILYERIGSIKLMLDGEMVKEWDLAKQLANIRFNESFGNVAREERPEKFRKWKASAFETRVKLGLRVEPFEEDVN